MKKRSNKKKFKLNYKITIAILLAILILTSIHILYTVSLFKGIETPLRICGSILIIDIIFLFTILGFKVKKKRNIKLLAVFSTILILYSGIITISSVKVQKIYSSLSGMSNNKGSASTYSTSIVVTKKSPLKNIDDAKKGIIGIIKEEGNIATYELPMQIIEKEKFDKKKIKTYDNHVDLLHDLLDEKIDAAFLPTQYTIMYSSDEFETLGDNTKIIYTKDQKEKEPDKTTQKSLDEPFTILVLGVDTTGDGIGSSFNGDALLLITFNPKTMNSTILSIPRDSYIPISCMNGRKNKITNAGWQGESCIMNSIENYFGIKIDYYYKINFNGVVSLVDALGGVDVEVPYSFCEQNSARKWGKNTIFVKEGKQHLNGEQALAYARCRHAYLLSDIARNKHQQQLIEAIAKRVANPSNINRIEELLNAVTNNLATNMSRNQILSLYDIMKNMVLKSFGDGDFLSIQKTYLEWYNLSVKLSNNGIATSAVGYYPGSLDAIINLMKANLELEEKQVIKTFSFDANENYKTKVTGQGITTGGKLETMPSFIGSSVSEVEAWANERGIVLNKEFVNSSSNHYNPNVNAGLVADQSVSRKVLVLNIKELTIYVNEATTQPPSGDNTPVPDNSDNNQNTDTPLDVILPNDDTKDKED